ncbi:MAG: SDR family oxidoreductase [Candidatus Marinimicrobia bacterium]|nr:SDR family oxidoreductase [Candidatus Neomarinimicrobiota bacterium]
MVYLITGGAGFIGSNIVEELLKRGEKVRVLDNFSTGKRENILPFLDRIELIEGDIRSYHIVREAVDGVDFVLHQAALPSVPRSIKDPITTNEVNVGGTLNILNAALDAGVKRVVYASSSSIYGNSEVLPKREDMTPNPMSPYAVSKLAGEKYCRVFSEIYGLETVCLRYFNVFGPRQDPNSQYSAVIPKFIAAMKKGERPTIYGDGKQSRDFTYVANVVVANLLVCQVNHGIGEIFNIACGERHSLINLINNLNEVLGVHVEPSFAEARKGDIRHSMADISKAQKMLGYSPFVNFEEGLRKTCCYRIYG